MLLLLLRRRVLRLLRGRRRVLLRRGRGILTLLRGRILRLLRLFGLRRVLRVRLLLLLLGWILGLGCVRERRRSLLSDGVGSLSIGKICGVIRWCGKRQSVRARRGEWARQTFGGYSSSGGSRLRLACLRRICVGGRSLAVGVLLLGRLLRCCSELVS